LSPAGLYVLCQSSQIEVAWGKAVMIGSAKAVRCSSAGRRGRHGSSPCRDSSSDRKSGR
jgi:hypothetical protein